MLAGLISATPDPRNWRDPSGTRTKWQGRRAGPTHADRHPEKATGQRSDELAPWARTGQSPHQGIEGIPVHLSPLSSADGGQESSDVSRPNSVLFLLDSVNT